MVPGQILDQPTTGVGSKTDIDDLLTIIPSTQYRPGRAIADYDIPAPFTEVAQFTLTPSYRVHRSTALLRV